MAGSIIVSGSLQEIRQKLEAMKATIQNRVSTGYRPLMHDEDWILVDARDEKVCKEECMPVRGKVYRGDGVLDAFPNAAFESATSIRANIHGGCRCTLEWVNASEVVTERLRQELEEVAS